MKALSARFGQALWGLAVLFAPLGVHAGAFAVNPVRVTLSAKQPIAALTVRNVGSEATLVQLESTLWSQEDGADHLAPSNDVLATPPIFTIPAGGTQIIRVGLRRKPDAQHELTYRLILHEVLPPQQPQTAGLRVALKISMPVFVEASVATAPALKWRAMRTSDGQIQLTARNTGTAHVQLGKIGLALAHGGQTIATHSTTEYVLPNNGRTWTVKADSAPAVGTLLRVSSPTDAGEVVSDVPLENDATESASAASGTAAR
jgi:fimbrial chaperone protein